ncbi:MAG: AbrB/MazE/SpoVT family DNA-binding domain-containing protein [Deltaproteobacteria bacterium]|nr:AbrB/MazE/SpoVT family DNA-binding domain-containing protein [Deltaproteobacteria bacterium]
MMISSATRLTTKGQIVIPKPVRARLGWKPGLRLAVQSDGEVVTLRPLAGSAARTWLAAVVGCVPDGDPVSDLEAEHRREVEADAHRRA